MRVANALLRFCLELLFVFALALGGASLGGWPLAVAAPIVAIVAWGRWIAPRASRPLSDPARLGAESMIFGAAAAALGIGAGAELGVAYAVVAAAHLALTFPLDQRRGGGGLEAR